MKNILKVMERSWDLLARENAPHFIDSERMNWNLDEFFAKGEREAGLFTDDVVKKWGSVPKGKRMLEIGCGIGRQTRGFSKMFGEVYAIDISNSMLTKAREFNSGLKNVKFIKTNGQDLRDFPDNYFDFVYSYGTFQHISDERLISGYFQEISRVLKIGGLFKIQLATHHAHHAFWSFAFGFIPVPSFIVDRLPFKIIDIYVHLRSMVSMVSMVIPMVKGLPYVMSRTTVSVIALTEMAQNSHLTLLDFFEEELQQKWVNTWCIGKKE